ncbi:hypothetical protein V8C26DRAFT_200231 [Trichoderma gracile]
MRGEFDVMMTMIGQNSLYALVAEWHLLIDGRRTFPINSRVTFVPSGLFGRAAEELETERLRGFASTAAE